MDPACHLLALDTATDALAVALCTPQGRWHRDAPGGAAASATLLPLVQQLLAEAGVRLADLQAVAFGQGPGAFTGLRTACAAAQGLGHAAGLPLLPIDNLALVAEMAAPADGAAETEWWVAVDARMDEVYAAAYRRPAAAKPWPDWQTLRAPALYTLPALAEAWRQAPPRALAGNAAAVMGDRLPAATGRTVAEPGGRAAALLRLAEAAWQQRRCVAAAEAMPLYLRDKVALTSAERQAARAQPPVRGA